MPIGRPIIGGPHVGQRLKQFLTGGEEKAVELNEKEEPMEGIEEKLVWGGGRYWGLRK